jgi:hypothetical protein
MVDAQWYAVRCIIDHGGTYEERITLWRAADAESAVELAEDEVESYAASLGGSEYGGLAQVFALADVPGHGTEVFSLMRDSELGVNEYLDAFFDTGTERQGLIED